MNFTNNLNFLAQDIKLFCDSYLLGFPMTNSNLPLTAVITTFLLPFLIVKAAVNDNYRKLQTYDQFTAVNGKRQICRYIYVEFTICLNKIMIVVDCGGRG